MVGGEKHAAAIWRQPNVPVIYRPPAGPLLVKLPYDATNAEWLRDNKQRRPHWNPKFKCWELPHAWLDWITRRIVRRFGNAWLIQPYRELEKCAPACWDAEGLECHCSCMGENHGFGRAEGRWYVISETCAVRWHDRKLSCQLITLDASR